MTLGEHIVATLLSPRVIIAFVWTGMAVLTVALVVLLRTGWGHHRPLRKCVVLSLFAHLLLIAMFTTIHFTHRHPGRGWGKGMRITLVDGHDAIDDKGVIGGVEGGRRNPPWEPTAETASIDPKLLDLPAAEDAALPDLTAAIDPDAPPQHSDDASVAPDDGAPAVQTVAASDTPSLPPNDPGPAPGVESQPAAQATSVAVDEHPAPTNIAETSDANAQQPEPIDVIVPGPSAPLDPGDRIVWRPRNNDSGASKLPSPPSSTTVGAAGPHTVPELYRQRVAPNRLQIAEGHGGSIDTEAAVSAALEWLARHQAADGRWDASDHGAGQETRTLGQDRGGAGAQADTGLTGLALLAFLGAGHTHRSEQYGAVVGRGLDYLLASQATDGNLAGRAESYAYMYCHGMATLAVSEDYALTGDQRLTRPLHRAIGYTIMAQSLSSGGWRYKPPYQLGERGDTSQLGWQLMSLKSAELSDIPIPERTRQGIVRYINSIASGRAGGLAAYRPQERPTHSMTAEALVCREFIGVSQQAAASEAADFLLTSLPGKGQANFYYWYYGTLAMFQLQGDQWTKWNDALTTALLHSQRIDADTQGSWDPDPIWGGHGGRIFSTSLGALCLEVYYRYLPVYTLTAGREKSAK